MNRATQADQKAVQADQKGLELVLDIRSNLPPALIGDPDRFFLNHIRPQRIGRRVKQRAALPRPPDTASVELGERIGSQPERPSGPSQRGGGVSLDRDFDLDERVRL